MQNKLSKKELNDIIQWDIKTWSRALSFWEKNAVLSEGKTVLAIGEREGGLSLWLAKKGLRVVCTDYNEFPETTEKIHQQSGFSDLISYENGVDVTDLSRFHGKQFDFVIFKSVLGALTQKERQLKAMKEMHGVLKPDGQLLFAENMIGTRFHRYLRKKFIRWDTYWRYLRFKQDKDLFKDFRTTKLKTTGFMASLGRSENQRSVLAFFDKGILWAIPYSWRYILFGVLTK